MLKSITGRERETIKLSILIVYTNMEKGRNPSILEVSQCSPDIAVEMEQLGYKELSVELHRAFIRTGDSKLLSPGDLAQIEDVKLECVLE